MNLLQNRLWLLQEMLCETRLHIRFSQQFGEDLNLPGYVVVPLGK